jgi:hypothetical protein
VSLKDQTLLKPSRKKIAEVSENLRIAQSRQKSYADRRRRELKFDVRSRLSKGLQNLWDTQIPRAQKASPTIHRPISRHQKDWCCSIQHKAARAIIKHAQHLSCVPTLELSLSAGRPSGARHLEPIRRSAISRSTHENLGHHDPKNPDARL